MRTTNVVSHTWGCGKGLAVVMAPVMPSWDQGQFFQPLINPLVQAGFRVMVFDTLSLLSRDNESLDQFTDRWQQALSPLGKIDFLAGTALGGAVVQSLLSKSLGKKVAKVLLLSAPTWADDILDSRLGHMADLAATGGVDEALQMLDRLVQPANRIIEFPPAPVDRAATELQARRLNLGFKLLHRLDLRDTLCTYAGPLLSVYGEFSQLVRRINVRTDEHLKQYQLEIPNGGMRPLVDAPQMVISAVNERLGLNLGGLA